MCKILIPVQTLMITAICWASDRCVVQRSPETHDIVEWCLGVIVTLIAIPPYFRLSFVSSYSNKLDLPLGSPIIHCSSYESEFFFRGLDMSHCNFILASKMERSTSAAGHATSRYRYHSTLEWTHHTGAFRQVLIVCGLNHASTSFLYTTFFYILKHRNFLLIYLTSPSMINAVRPPFGPCSLLWRLKGGSVSSGQPYARRVAESKRMLVESVVSMVRHARVITVLTTLRAQMGGRGLKFKVNSDPLRCGNLLMNRLV